MSEFVHSRVEINAIEPSLRERGRDLIKNAKKKKKHLEERTKKCIPSLKL